MKALGLRPSGFGTPSRTVDEAERLHHIKGAKERDMVMLT